MRRHPFDLLMELKTSQIRLDCAALHLARDFYPSLNISKYLQRLDALAEDVAALRPGLAANLRYEALRAVLVDECGLTGNHTDYYDPQNSLLNCVLDSGRGTSISLSVVWMEVARRLKWPVSGVGLPGHFIVRFDDPERFVLANPFHEGRALSVDDCRVLVRESFEGRIPFTTAYLKPVNKRGILLRVLRNLRNIYLANDDLVSVSTILRRMAAVEPMNGRHLQDLAAICARQGNVRGAWAFLELYQQRVPNAHDADLVQHNLHQLHAAILAWN